MVVKSKEESFTTVDGQHPVVHRSWKRPRPIIDYGEGIYLYDKDGKRYIDGSSGTSVVVNLGHGVHSIVEAMYEQGKKVAFASPHFFTNEPMLKLGGMIQERAPGEMRNHCRTWFSCTGTDAVDDAVRLARQYCVAKGKSSKYVMVSRWQQFHGNQLGMAGVAGHTDRRRLLYPMFVNSPHIPPAYCYRCPFGDTYPSCNLKCARALETEIRQTGEENVAAFLAEPVVGASLGAMPAPDGYFDVIRDICDRYDVLLIVDEVMTAWGRTGVLVCHGLLRRHARYHRHLQGSHRRLHPHRRHHRPRRDLADPGELRLALHGRSHPQREPARLRRRRGNPQLHRRARHPG